MKKQAINLTFLIFFPLLIILGVWQIHRGNEKKRIQVEFLKRQSANPIQLNQTVPVSVGKNYFPVLATGHFDNQHNFLLDNKIYQHHIGYEVLTPFILKNSMTIPKGFQVVVRRTRASERSVYGIHEHASPDVQQHHNLKGEGYIILINRGWIPQGRNRKILPLIKAVNGNMTINGLLVWPTKTFSFKSVAEKKWPQRIQTLDPDFLNKKHYQPFIIVVNKQQPYGFIPLWQAVTWHASRHYAYAFQWFALAVTLFIAVSILRKTKDVRK